MQETPGHIMLGIFSAVCQSTAILYVLRSYVRKYQKSYWFSVLFVGIEFAHRLFRTVTYYWIPAAGWNTEYFMYIAAVFLIVHLLLRGNLWRNLGNIYCGYNIFNLIGTVSGIGMFYLVEGFDLDAAIYVMNRGRPEYAGYFLLLIIFNGYISKKICDVFFKINDKRIEWFKLIHIFVWIYMGSSTSFELLFVGIIVFAILGFICISDQKKKYGQLREEFARLKEMNGEYTEKLKEISKVRHDISNHLTAAQIGEGLRDDVTANIAYVEAYTGIKTLDCLLEYKLQICRKEKIKTYIKSCDISDYPVSVYDWVGIFSNLLDNATEACKSMGRGQERFIGIGIFEEKDQMVIKVANSKSPVTDKKDGNKNRISDPYKDQRGLGIEIVRETVERNQGELVVEDAGILFMAEIIFGNKKQETVETLS